jgi:hypothetical protein
MSFQYVKTTTASRREERHDNRRYLHVSCDAYMTPDPAGQALPMIPYIGPGTTYNVGRNRAKRERRAQARG